MPIFEGLGPAVLAAIAQHAGERFLPQGSKLTIGRDGEGSVLLVIDGELEDGASRRYGRGDAAGFLELLSRSGAGPALTAVTDTMTLEFPWEAQLDVGEEHFAVVMRYAAYLAARIARRGADAAPAEYGPVPLIAAQAFGQPLDLNERLLLLSRSQAFSARCLDALSELTHHVEELAIAAGDRIWTAGDAADFFLLMASGAMRLDYGADRAAVYRAGTSPGIEEALARRPRRQSAACLEDAVALRIDIEPFIDILEDHFDLSLDLLATLAKRLLQSL